MTHAIIYQQDEIQNGNSVYTLSVIREDPESFILRSGIGPRVKGLRELPPKTNARTYLEDMLTKYDLKAELTVCASDQSGLVDLLPIDAAIVERIMQQEGFQRVTQQ